MRSRPSYRIWYWVLILHLAVVVDDDDVVQPYCMMMMMMMMMMIMVVKMMHYTMRLDVGEVNVPLRLHPN